MCTPGESPALFSWWMRDCITLPTREFLFNRFSMSWTSSSNMHFLIPPYTSWDQQHLLFSWSAFWLLNLFLSTYCVYSSFMSSRLPQPCKPCHPPEISIYFLLLQPLKPLTLGLLSLLLVCLLRSGESGVSGLRLGVVWPAFLLI